MDALIFKVLRGAAIVFYVIAMLGGLLMLYGLVQTVVQISEGSIVEPSSLLLALSLTLVPLGVGFAFDRLAAIGTRQV